MRTDLVFVNYFELRMDYSTKKENPLPIQDSWWGKCLTLIISRTTTKWLKIPLIKLMNYRKKVEYFIKVIKNGNNKIKVIEFC